VKVTLWGTRGSLASPGPDTTRYGGNTSCVEVRGSEGTVLVLDAGTGIRRLGASIMKATTPPKRVDLLLTHLHMDHIQGLGFFAPIRTRGMEVHVWGPASTTQSLWMRLTRYLSPPLFPVRLREVECTLELHEVPCPDVEIGEFRVSSALVCHPGPTVGYRIDSPAGVVTYIPDHEPALGVDDFPHEADWTSGYALAEGADLLIHDAQYNDAEYDDRPGWGHSSMRQAFAFARLAGVKRLVPFHHDPSHTDDYMDRFISQAVEDLAPPFAVSPGMEEAAFDLSRPGAS
jgi:phosphoribosyl 1,2-cyclic phosphodiesterase